MERAATSAAAGPHAPLPKGALGTLDWLRALAAFAVLVGHVRGLFFVDYGDLERPGLLARLVYLLTGLGHQAVVVFFVLSGFFIGYTVLQSQSSGRFSLRDYALRRFARIYVVLVPALLVTLLVDRVGLALFGIRQTVYGGEVRAPFLELPFIPGRLGIETFLGNLFQLQPFGVEDYGSNGVLWSLPFEVWAYALFPLVVLAVAQPRPARRILTAALCFAALALGHKAPLYLSIWSMGAVIAWWWLRAPRDANGSAKTWWPLCIAALSFIALVFVGRVQLLKLRALEDLLVGIATSLFVVAILRRPGAWERGPTARVGAWLAGFSYSVYLFHQPAVTFIHAATMGSERWMPTPMRTLAALGWIALVLLAWCYPLSLLTERHTDRLRAWLASWGRDSSRVDTTAS